MINTMIDIWLLPTMLMASMRIVRTRMMQRQIFNPASIYWILSIIIIFTIIMLFNHCLKMIFFADKNFS